MAEHNIKQIIGQSFLDIAEGIQSGSFGKKIKVGLTTLGSEHGIENLVEGAELAVKKYGVEVVLIGPEVKTELRCEIAESEVACHKKMEALIDSGEIDAAVTMHYTFPIGTSTVGKVVTPGFGREMFLATTTGTSAAKRNEAMVKNALYGIIAAKATGEDDPSVGILNLDGARQVERALKTLDENGYPIRFASSMRADGGVVMRGNDLLSGACDVMVTDTLTGNIMMKVFSSFSTGGSYEASGCGYGPGISEDMSRIVMILSRASGIPVVAGAIEYAAKLARGDVKRIAKTEYQKARAAGLDQILAGFDEKNSSSDSDVATYQIPEKEIVTAEISGIDILDLEDAVAALHKAGIYAESGMGCTGPIALISEVNKEKAVEILTAKQYIL